MEKKKVPEDHLVTSEQYRLKWCSTSLAGWLNWRNQDGIRFLRKTVFSMFTFWEGCGTSWFMHLVRWPVHSSRPRKEHVVTGECTKFIESTFTTLLHPERVENDIMHTIWTELCCNWHCISTCPVGTVALPFTICAQNLWKRATSSQNGRKIH